MQRIGNSFATKRDRLALVIGVVAFVVIAFLMGMIRPEYYISEIKQRENSAALIKSESRECRDFQLKLASYAPNSSERINFIAIHSAKMGECFPAISRSRTYESTFLNSLFGLLCGLALWLSYRRNYKEFIISSFAVVGSVACIYFDSYGLEWYSPYLNVGLIMAACYFLLFVKKWVYSGA